jgi:hypothetical protein
MQETLAAQGLQLRLRLPDVDGKLRPLSADVKKADATRPDLEAQNIDITKLYGAKPDKKALDMIRGDVFFDLPPVCVCMNVYVCMYIYICVCVCVSVCVCVCVYTHTQIHTYIHTYIQYTCIHAYIHTHTHTHNHINAGGFR